MAIHGANPGDEPPAICRRAARGDEHGSALSSHILSKLGCAFCIFKYIFLMGFIVVIIPNFIEPSISFQPLYFIDKFDGCKRCVSS